MVLISIQPKLKMAFFHAERAKRSKTVGIFFKQTRSVHTALDFLRSKSDKCRVEVDESIVARQKQCLLTRDFLFHRRNIISIVGADGNNIRLGHVSKLLRSRVLLLM